MASDATSLAALALDLSKFALPLIGGAIAWLWNERRKRASEEYERKEKKYTLLVEGLQLDKSNRRHTPSPRHCVWLRHSDAGSPLGLQRLEPNAYGCRRDKEPRPDNPSSIHHRNARGERYLYVAEC